MELFPFEVRWAETLGRAIVPRGVLGGVVDDLEIGERYRQECRTSPWYAALLMRFSLWLTWLAPLWLERRARTFAGLSRDQQEALLDRLLTLDRHNLRLAVTLLKLTVCTLLLGDERVFRRLGAYRLGAS